MWAVLLGQGGEAVLPGDATCVLSIRQQQQHRCAAEPNRLVGKLNGVKGLVKLLSAAQRQHSPPEAVDKQRQHTPGAFGPKAGGFKSKGSNPASHSTPWRSGLRANTQKQDATRYDNDEASNTVLIDIPAVAADRIFQRLGKDARRAVLLSSKPMRALFSRSVRALHLTAADLKRCGAEQLGRLPLLFPDLNELHLTLGSDTAALLQLRQAGQSGNSHLAHLHTFSLDSRVRDGAFQALARFLVKHPHLTKLLLPHQRCSAPAGQRVLAALLEALPGLTHLDLGYTPSSSSSSSSSAAASNAITPSVFRRILRLKCLRSLSCNATAVPDSQLAALGVLCNLQDLSISATGSGQGLAEALPGLQNLTSLELQHSSIAGELVGCFTGLMQLQVLALGLCPKLSDAILPEVAQMQQLEKLAVPFSLSAPQLRLLSHLSHLQELLTWRQVELDVLGPAHEPMRSVTRLVASSIQGHGKPLAAWFPALEAVCLKHCTDMAALSLRSCAGIQELLAGECSLLTNEGFACLKDLKALQRLQLDRASQVTDVAFSAVFSGTMPVLQHVSLGGCSGVTDRALQLLTASCRRLSNISISSCSQLTDKTLKRLAHCEHLGTVVLRGCRGFSAEGVSALAAAPQMKSVAVNGCVGVRSSLCKGYRPAVRVRVEDRL